MNEKQVKQTIEQTMESHELLDRMWQGRNIIIANARKLDKLYPGIYDDADIRNTLEHLGSALEETECRITTLETTEEMEMDQ